MTISKNSIIAAAVIIIMAIAAATGAIWAANRKTHMTPAPTPSSSSAASHSGKVVCLPFKGDGPHIAICTYGLQGIDGKYYGVKNSRAITDYPINADVTIEGPVEAPANDETFDIAGYINVTKITQN